MITDPEEDYARGFVPFLGVSVFLDSRPLIPRVETEFWIEKVLEALRSYTMIYHSIRTLDLFAGSGCIGLAVLKHVPSARVDFGEINAAHFPTIEKSLCENGIDAARTQMIETDVWSNVSDTYDFVLANPPYLSKESEVVEQSVTAHEPHAALFAEDGGFALIEKTVAGARSHLTPGGQLWLEHDPEQSARLATLAATHALSIETKKDQFDVLRFSILRPVSNT
jgi:release factor glutamine methyltransferase